jgi:hypothetical protein
MLLVILLHLSLPHVKAILAIVDRFQNAFHMGRVVEM